MIEQIKGGDVVHHAHVHLGVRVAKIPFSKLMSVFDWNLKRLST